MKKKNKSNSELTRLVNPSIKSSARKTKKDLTYYYSLTNVKYYDDDDEDEEAVAGNNSSSKRCSLSSSLSSISSSKNQNQPQTSTSASVESYASSSSTSDEEADVALESATPIITQQQGDGEEPIQFYRLQKSITLPNANEIAQLASTGQSIGGYIKARSSSSLIDEQEEQRFADDNAALMSATDGVYTTCRQQENNNLLSPVVTRLKMLNPSLNHQHKSLSDYCVTSSRYILSRFRRRYRTYRNHFRCHSINRCYMKMSKSMSVNRRG